MAKSEKASAHIVPCNVYKSEAHNKRTKAYMEALAKSKNNKVYVRTELSKNNASWVAADMKDQTLLTYLNFLKKLVKEKTGRAMQTKAHKRIDKKTGRVKTIQGCSPIREDVIRIKEDTTLEDLKRYCQMCHESFGVTAKQIYIHKDEGHWDKEDQTLWKPNYHAHIIWDWVDHETGKTIKVDSKDMSQFQDYAAAALGMERGTSKSETNSEWMPRKELVPFLEEKEKIEAEVAEAERQRDTVISKTKEEFQNLDTLKKKKKTLEDEVDDKTKKSKELEKLIAEKKQKADKEAKESIKNRISHIIGKGDYHDLEKELKSLKQQIAELQSTVPNRLKSLKESFNKIVSDRVEEITVPIEEELFSTKVVKENLENKCAQLKQEVAQLRRTILNEREETKQKFDNEVSLKVEEKVSEKLIAAGQEIKELQSQYNNLVIKYNAMTKAKDAEISRLKAAVLLLGKFLCKIDGAFKAAVNTITTFAKSYFNLFDGKEAGVVRTAMDHYSDNPEGRSAIGEVMATVAIEEGELSESESQKASQEVEDVAQGRYDSRIARSYHGGMSR